MSPPKIKAKGILEHCPLSTPTPGWPATLIKPAGWLGLSPFQLRWSCVACSMAQHSPTLGSTPTTAGQGCSCSSRSSCSSGSCCSAWGADRRRSLQLRIACSPYNAHRLAKPFSFLVDHVCKISTKRV